MEEKNPTRQEHRRLSTVLLVAVLALLIVANLILNAFATRFGWYLYEKERYEHTVGEASRSLLSDVPEGERVRVIFCMAEEELKGDEIYALVLSTVRQLAERHSFIDVEFVNIYLNPGRVKHYRERTTVTGEKVVSPITEESVIFSRGEGEGEVFRVESLESFFILDDTRMITAYNGEETALSCLLWTLRDEHPVAGFTGSHGESYGDMLAFYTTLVAAGYDISLLDLTEEIPAGTELIVIANPKWDFDRGSGIRAELDRLSEFLDGGGDLFVSLDPYAKMPLTGLREFLAERGLAASQDVVRDMTNSITYDGYTLVTEPADGPLGTAMSDRIGSYTDARTLVREASTITCSEVGSWQAEPLLLSSPSAETYRDGKRVGDAGRYAVLAASVAETEGGRATVILSSSVYLLANDALNSATYANRDSVLAALELASERQVPIGCHILAVGNDRLEDLTMGTARLYATLLILALPLAIGAVGAAVLIRRKNR